MKKILFSEHETYYRSLGLRDIDGLEYVFGGSRFYNKEISFFKKFSGFVCAFYTMPHNTLLTLKFKSLNKRTLLCSDGIFEFSNAFENPMITKYRLSLFHPIIQDCFLSVGKREANYFSQDVEVIQYMPERMLSQTDVIDLSKDTKVLITTANTAYFNELEFCRLKSLISEVAELLSYNSIKFCFRIFDEKLLSALNVDHQVYNDINRGFEETLADYNSVITTPSSIAITAMYHRRSVALLVYRDWPMYLQAGWLLPSAKVLESSLQDFISLEESRIEIQNKILKSYITEVGITECIDKALVSKPNYNCNKVDAHIDISMMNMLESKFNFNVEWYVRKLYLKFKSNKVFKDIRKWIK
ncbi:hypothetical protein [Vibrio sp. B1Z05]|uniref:hypothetical protein n=1 Tax=Vibrio sp. B1Z05 TaxID=2654980 RepID=UPI00128B5D4D|nr:hypothetical protein [Vibrio sp. B1Z05]MPW36247.1 hypothetical protein [Vibrio sp. B1Z05]